MESRGRSRRGRRRSQLDGDNLEDVDVMPAPTGSWIVAAGVFLIHLNIPSFVFSYGVLLVHLQDDSRCSLSTAVLPPFFYVATWLFTDPVCRRAVSGHSPQAKYMAFAGVIIVTGCIAINALLQSLLLLVFTYGILGGMGTSLILSQAEAVLTCHFPSQRGLVQGVTHASMALGYFGMPLLLNGLISVYGTQGGLLLQAGVVLQAAVGAVLLHPPGKDIPQLPYYARPRTYSLIDDIEMTDMSDGNSHSGHSPLLPQRSWKNPGMNSIGLTSPIMQVRHKNINGVDILPEIPEESEDSEDSDDPQSTSVLKAHVVDWDVIDLGASANRDSQRSVNNKRILQRNSLSKWQSIHLKTERMSNSDEQKDKFANGSVNSSLSSSSSCELNQNRDFKSLLPHRISDRLRYYHSPFHRIRKLFGCGCCNWYCRFKFHVAVLRFPHRLNNFVLRPLWTALKEPKFLPAFCLHTVSRVSFVMFSSLTPYLVWSKVTTSSFQETAFSVSVAAFTWLCFLLISPCFSGVKPRSYKYIYFCGCLISISGISLLSACNTQSCIIISCAIFGFGQGAISNSGPIFVEDELSTSKLLILQGSVDGVSGCLTLLLAIVTGIVLEQPQGIVQAFVSLAAFQSITALLWCLSLLMPFLQKVPCQHKRISCWLPENDFMTPG